MLIKNPSDASLAPLGNLHNLQIKVAIVFANISAQDIYANLASVPLPYVSKPDMTSLKIKIFIYIQWKSWYEFINHMEEILTLLCEMSQVDTELTLDFALIVMSTNTRMVLSQGSKQTNVG